MSHKRRLKVLEERLNVNKEELQPLVVILGAWSCPLETKKRDKCKVYQEKEKEALAKKPGEIKPLAVINLDCQERCPYLSGVESEGKAKH